MHKYITPYTAYPTCPPLAFLITHAFPYVAPEELHEELVVDLHRLKQAGLVDSFSLSMPVPKLKAPLAITGSDDPDPDMGPLAWALKKRWENAESRTLDICYATAKAAKVFGGVGGRIRQPLQVSHDLMAASAFFRRLETHPNDAHLWRSEMLIRSYCPTTPFLPDAVILDRDYRAPARAIEIGGATYGRKKLLQFAQNRSRLRLPFEIW